MEDAGLGCRVGGPVVGDPESGMEERDGLWIWIYGELRDLLASTAVPP